MQGQHVRRALTFGVAMGSTIALLTAGPAGAAPTAADDVNASGVTVIQPVLTQAGSTPSAVAVGDINGDGILDLAESNAHANTVRFILGLGGGRFQDYDDQLPWSIPSVSDLPDIVLADINADGLLDVAVSAPNLPAPAVHVRLGTGTSNLFAPEVVYPVAAGAHDLAAADLNGDGATDLVVVNEAADVVSVLLADGTGGLLPPSEVAVGSMPRGLDVADLDGDGELDLAVANRGSDTVSVRLGVGDGTFLDGGDVPVRSVPTDLSIADMDGDGQADLVVGSNDEPAPDRSTVALYDGADGFAETASYRVLVGLLTVTTLDWDGDARPDIAVTTGIDGAFGGSVRGYLTIAAGGFGPDAERYASRVGNRPTDIAVADLDADGDQDIVSARSSNLLALVFNPLG